MDPPTAFWAGKRSCQQALPSTERAGHGTPGDTKCCHFGVPTRWRGGIRWHKDPSHPRHIRDGCAHPRSIQLTGNARDELQGPEHTHGPQRPQVHVGVEMCPSRGEDAVGTQGQSWVNPGKALGHFSAVLSHGEATRKAKSLGRCRGSAPLKGQGASFDAHTQIQGLL